MDERQNILPSIPLPTDFVEIDGNRINFRSLSRKEALKIGTDFQNNADGAETFILSCGVGVSLEEAEEWLRNTDPLTAGKVIDGIILLTGLSDKVSKA